MTTIIKGILNRWSASGVIEKEDEDIYEYGLDLILFSILNLIVIFTTAAIFRKLFESIVLMAAIVPLQAYGGGYHAKTHLRCFLIMYSGWWVVMFILLPLISTFPATILNIAAVIIVFLLAPVAHVNVTMSASRRSQLRKYVRITVFAIAIISSALIWFVRGGFAIGVVLTVGIGASALSMLIAYCMNRIRQRKARCITRRCHIAR